MKPPPTDWLFVQRLLLPLKDKVNSVPSQFSVFLLISWIVSACSLGLAPTPHPLPEGHVYRDLQVTVTDQSVTLDIGMKASDMTWTQIISMADQELQQYRSKETQVPSDENAKDTGESAASAPAPGTLDQFQAKLDRESYLPLPTNEDEVAVWLTREANREILEWWTARHVVAQWDADALPLTAKIRSQQNSRHHWAINVELTYQMQDVSQLDKASGKLTVVLDAFKKYPGQVRRALKARGQVFIENSEFSSAVVRADFEPRTEDDSDLKRCETVQATVRF